MARSSRIKASMDAPLGRDETSRVAIKDCVRPDGHPAQTEFVVEKRFFRPNCGSSEPMKGPSPSYGCSRGPAANIKSAFTWRTSAIPSWAINFTGATRISTSPWSKDV